MTAIEKTTLSPYVVCSEATFTKFHKTHKCQYPKQEIIIRENRRIDENSNFECSICYENFEPSCIINTKQKPTKPPCIVILYDIPTPNDKNNTVTSFEMYHYECLEKCTTHPITRVSFNMHNPPLHSIATWIHTTKKIDDTLFQRILSKAKEWIYTAKKIDDTLPQWIRSEAEKTDKWIKERAPSSCTDYTWATLDAQQDAINNILTPIFSLIIRPISFLYRIIASILSFIALIYHTIVAIFVFIIEVFATFILFVGFLYFLPDLIKMCFTCIMYFLHA